MCAALALPLKSLATDNSATMAPRLARAAITTSVRIVRAPSSCKRARWLICEGSARAIIQPDKAR
jgi:hypothetical protein